VPNKTSKKRSLSKRISIKSKRSKAFEIFQSTFQKCTSQLLSHKSTTPLFVMLAAEMRKAAARDFEKFMETNGNKTTSSNGNTDGYNLEAKHRNALKTHIRRINEYKLALEMLQRSSLITIFGVYDETFGNLLRAIAATDFAKHLLKEKDVKADVIFSSADWASAKETVIEKLVLDIQHKSHLEQIEYLEGLFAKNGKKSLLRISDDQRWETFIEASQRRHLFVHTGGIVSEKYLIGIREISKDTTRHAVGDQLGVSGKYFADSVDAVFEQMFCMIAVCWRICCKDESKNINSDLISVAFDCLDRGNYELSTRLFKFIQFYTCDKDSEDEALSMINLAQSYKWQGMNQESQEVLSKIPAEWMAKDRYRLAYHVLRDEFDLAADMLERYNPEYKISEADFLDWPLFKEFRNHSRFNESFKIAFGRYPENGDLIKRPKVVKQDD